MFRLLSLLVSCLLPVLALTAKEMIESAIQCIKSGAYIVIRLGGFFLVRFFFPLPAPIPNKHQVESKFTSKVLIRSLFIKKVTVGE